MDSTLLVPLLDLVALVSNLVIAASYAAIGLYLAPRFDAAVPDRRMRLAKLAAVAFFVTCAMTHLDLAWHVHTRSGIFTGAAWTPGQTVPVHFLLVHTVQALAAPLFFLAASGALVVAIYNRDYYEQFLARRIAEAEEAIIQARGRDAVRAFRAHGAVEEEPPAVEDTP